MKYTILAAVLVLGCTTVHDSTVPRAAAPPPSDFQNLLVLPRDISHDDLIATMRGFNRSLGVKCNFCHVVTTTEPKQEFNFPSDEKEEKRIARVMLQMTQQINGPWLARVEQAEGHEHDHSAAEAEVSGEKGPRVTCWTCHRGREEPEMPPPPPVENAAPRPS